MLTKSQEISQEKLKKDCHELFKNKFNDERN